MVARFVVAPGQLAPASQGSGLLGRVDGMACGPFGAAQVRDNAQSTGLLAASHASNDHAVFGALKLWLDVDADGASEFYEVFGMAELGIGRIELGAEGPRIVWSDGQESAVRERRFGAEEDGVAVSRDSVGNTVVRAEDGVDGQGTDAQLTYVTHADDLSRLAKLTDPQADLTAEERAELEALAGKYGLDSTNVALMASLVAGGGNVAGSLTEIVVKAEDVVSDARPEDAEEQRQARVETLVAQMQGEAGTGALSAEQVAARLSAELGVSVQVARAVIDLGLSQDSQTQQMTEALRRANAPAVTATVLASAAAPAVGSVVVAPVIGVCVDRAGPPALRSRRMNRSSVLCLPNRRAVVGRQLAR